MKNWVFVLITIISFTACTQIDLYEKNTVIPGSKWNSDYAASGSFTITDTISSYKVFIVLRHTDMYRYNNIWLNVGLQPPGDSMRFQRKEIQFGNDANGWFGVGMNDIWELRSAITDEPKRFLRAGTYNFSITQIMRDDPLNHVMSAGIRLEKQ